MSHHRWSWIYGPQSGSNKFPHGVLCTSTCFESLELWTINPTSMEIPWLHTVAQQESSVPLLALQSLATLQIGHLRSLSSVSIVQEASCSTGSKFEMPVVQVTKMLMPKDAELVTGQVMHTMGWCWLYNHRFHSLKPGGHCQDGTMGSHGQQ
jgi:hypothetical protein